MIRISGPHLGVEIPTDVLTQLTDAGPNTSRLRDLYVQCVLHVVAENIDTLTLRPDEVDGLAAPNHTGIVDAESLADYGLLDRVGDNYALAGVDVYGIPAPKGKGTRVDAILGYATEHRLPFAPKDIADMLGITVRMAGTCLSKMYLEGRLERVGRGLYTIPTLPVDDPVDNPVDESTQKYTEGSLERGVDGSTSPGPRARASKNSTTNTKTTTTTNNLTATTEPKNLKTNYGVDYADSTSPESPRKKRSGRPTRIPIPFLVDDSMREWASRRAPLVDIDAETENFVDYWASKATNATKLDWGRTWQMWMRRAPQFTSSALRLRRPATVGEWRNPECPDGMDVYGEEYAALKRRAKAEWRAARGSAS